MEHTIIVSPHRRRDGSTVTGRFEARLKSHPDQILCTSREPLLTAARVLLRTQIAKPDDTLAMRHSNSDTIALRAKVGAAARLTVQESADRSARFVRWRPHLVEVPSKTRENQKPKEIR